MSSALSGDVDLISRLPSPYRQAEESVPRRRAPCDVAAGE